MSDHITQTHAALKAQGSHTPTVLGALNLLRSQRENSAPLPVSSSPSVLEKSVLSDDSDDEPLASHKINVTVDGDIGSSSLFSRPHRSSRHRTPDVSTPLFSFPSPPILPAMRSLRQSPNVPAIETPSSMLPGSPILKTFPSFEDILLNSGGKHMSCASAVSLENDSLLASASSLSLSSSSSSSSHHHHRTSSSCSSLRSPCCSSSSSCSSSSPSSPSFCCSGSAASPRESSSDSSPSAVDTLDPTCSPIFRHTQPSTALAIKFEKPILRKRQRRMSGGSDPSGDEEDESSEFQTWGAHSAMLPQLTPPIKPLASIHKTSSNDPRPHAQCHQCKTRKKGSLVQCRQPPPHPKKSIVCKKKYCHNCLVKFYEEQPPQTTYWVCPSCRQMCCCLICWRAKCKADVSLSPASALASALVFFPDLLHSAMSGKDAEGLDPSGVREDSDSQEGEEQSPSSPSPSPPQGQTTAPAAATTTSFFQTEMQINPYAAPELYPGFRPDQGFYFAEQFPMLFQTEAQPTDPNVSAEHKSFAQEMEHNEEFQQQYQKAYHQHYQRHYHQQILQQYQQQEMLMQQAKMAESHHLEHLQNPSPAAPVS